MDTETTKCISLTRNFRGNFNYTSPSYEVLDITECQLMTLLGGVLAVNLTNPRFSKCSWKIEITKISTE